MTNGVLLECSDCLDAKPPSEFYRDNRPWHLEHRFGRQGICKACTALRAKAASKTLTELRRLHKEQYRAIYERVLRELREEADQPS